MGGSSRYRRDKGSHTSRSGKTKPSFTTSRLRPRRTRPSRTSQRLHLPGGM
uniref:Uncharacterized protein n=1 Tax=Arundo donax TaxID=35708 RepID=A0A0A8Y454_ARUDO